MDQKHNEVCNESAANLAQKVGRECDSSSSGSTVSADSGGKLKKEEIKIPVPYGHISGKWWGPKAKQPVIAIHGWQDNAGTWDNLIPLLPENMSFLAIDLPGHGWSSHYPPGHFYYLYWDGVITIRRIVKYFNWNKITLLGHSLGGSIAFLYAGVFPQDVEKIISIDIVGPKIRESDNSTTSESKAIEQLLKYETLTADNVPSYTYEEMIDLAEDAYKGSITRESCKILMKRGMAHSPNKKGYHFSRDVRLKVTGLSNFSQDFVLNVADKIRCNVLNIKGDPGMFTQKSENYYMLLDKIKEKAHVEFHEVPGTHHLHLNTPERVSGIIGKFLEQPVVIKKIDENNGEPSVSP